MHEASGDKLVFFQEIGIYQKLVLYSLYSFSDLFSYSISQQNRSPTIWFLVSKQMQGNKDIILNLKSNSMTSFQKRTKQRSCNCRNSKCIKLYCECFAAGVPCTKNCLCMDCQNKSRNHNSENPIIKDFGADFCKKVPEIGKSFKGCACRKSGCTKKYCQCFQAGRTCTQLCKCVQCQNNESLSNRKIISVLKGYQGDQTQKSIQLFPLVLSQNSDQVNNIIKQSNPLNLDQQYLTKYVKQLFSKAKQGGQTAILESFMCILDDLEKKVNDRQQAQKNEEENQQKIENADKMIDQNDENQNSNEDEDIDEVMSQEHSQDIQEDQQNEIKEQ